MNNSVFRDFERYMFSLCEFIPHIIVVKFTRMQGHADAKETLASP